MALHADDIRKRAAAIAQLDQDEQVELTAKLLLDTLTEIADGRGRERTVYWAQGLARAAVAAVEEVWA